MRALWEAIEGAIGERLPGASLKLRAGASEAELAAAEAALGMSLPDDFRASVAVHDGQEDWPDVMWLPFVQRLGSLASIVDCWRDDRPYWDEADPEGRWEWLDRSRRVRQVLFHPRQIPIAGSEGWDYDRLLLDFAPGPDGCPGQVIARADVELAFVTTSFRALLERTLAGLRDGTIDFVESGVGEPRWEVRYLSPRAKKPIGPNKFFSV